MHPSSLYSCVIICILANIPDVSVCQECQTERQLNNNQYVDEVTVNDSPINHNNLFEFGNCSDAFYCGPDNVGSFDVVISYFSPVLLREIGIDGDEQTFARDDYVTSFSLSFSEDGDNFTDYIRDTGSPVFNVSDASRHYFRLWPPITASSIKITINSWNDRPCMNLLMLGCNYSNVLNHSINDSGLVGDMTVVLTTTETSCTATITQTTTESLTETTAEITTESITVTVTVDVAHTPSPSPSQSGSAVVYTSCSSDTDNTPIYVAVVIVIVGLLIMIIANIVAVILYHRYLQGKQCNGSNNPVAIETRINLHADEKLKLESDIKSKQAAPSNNQRLETVNLGYESVDDPRRTITDQYYPFSSIPGVTSKNDSTVVDNPAYSTSSGPPLVDNPAYITAIKGGPETTTVLSHDMQ